MAAKKRALRFVEPMERQALEWLHTGSLIARLKKLQSLHESYEQSDWTEEQRLAVADKIAFKNTEIWKKAHRDVKSVLAGREHVPRGGKARRREAARSGRNK